MRKVVIISPYAGDVERNLRYADACVADSLARGESPIASHLVYTRRGVLRDDVPEERERGMRAGWAWISVADAVVVCADLGISDGMRRDMDRAVTEGCSVAYRELGDWERGELE